MNKRILYWLLPLVVIVAASAFWYTYLVSDAPPVVRVGYLPLVVNLPLFTAIEEGYFEKHGIQIEAVEAQSPNHIVEAILSGNLDGAGVLAYPIIFAAEEKAPGELLLFATGDETMEEFVSSILVTNDSNIQKPEDLKGKKIGVYTGLVQVIFLKSIMKGMGLNPERDMEIVQIEPRLQLQGLIAGQYEALSTVEPFPTIAHEKGIARVLIENPRVKYIQNPFPSVATVVSHDFVRNHPDATQAYVSAIDDAIELIQKNPKKAKKYLQKYTPTPEADTLKVNMLKFNKNGEQNVTHIQKNADWMFEQGLMKKKIDVSSLFNHSFN